MDQLELANRFDGERRRLRSVAYRIVGSLSEADDAVQETWLRLQRAEAEEIDNLERWLTTVVARICLNILRDRRSHAEEPLDAFVPEPDCSNARPKRPVSSPGAAPTRAGSAYWKVAAICPSTRCGQLDPSGPSICRTAKEPGLRSISPSGSLPTSAFSKSLL